MTTVACAVFAGLTNVTDGQTDGFAVAIDRTLLAMFAKNHQETTIIADSIICGSTTSYMNETHLS